MREEGAGRPVDTDERRRVDQLPTRLSRPAYLEIPGACEQPVHEARVTSKGRGFLLPPGLRALPCQGELPISQNGKT